jgi:NADPH:quinone reductase-like Zn-dependent oxidoreductase
VKRIQYYRYGGPEEMRFEEFELPKPSSGQVIVKMVAASVNPMDLKMRSGGMKMMSGRRFPRPMGSDFAGVVDAVGESVTRLKVGDEVFGTARMWPSGAFAERVLTDEKLLARKPASLSFELASTLPTVGIAAWRGLMENAKLTPGQKVFVHGCLGGVGRAAVQIAQASGAKVGGSCRRGAMEEAKRLGLDPVVDFDNTHLISLQGQFDTVFDTVSKLTWRDSQNLLTRNGVCIDTNVDIGKLLRGMFGGRYKLVAALPSQERLKKVADLAVAGTLAPPIDRTVSLSEAVAAITELERQGRSKGKLVILNEAK